MKFFLCNLTKADYCDSIYYINSPEAELWLRNYLTANLE